MAVLRKPPYDPDQNRYPKWVGKVIVQNQEEHDALLAKEDAKPEVKAEVKTEAKADDKDALVAQATDLGIDVDKRWGVERLKTEIAAKQKAA